MIMIYFVLFVLIKYNQLDVKCIKNMKKHYFQH